MKCCHISQPGSARSAACSFFGAAGRFFYEIGQAFIYLIAELILADICNLQRTPPIRQLFESEKSRKCIAHRRRGRSGHPIPNAPRSVVVAHQTSVHKLSSADSGATSMMLRAALRDQSPAHNCNRRDRPRYSPACWVQFSIFRSGTRPNSPVLSVTSVKSRERECAAIRRSFAPIMVPRILRAARICA